MAAEYNPGYTVRQRGPFSFEKGISRAARAGRDVLDVLGVSEGDQLFAVRTPHGIRLTPYDPDFVKVIESTRDYMRRHRNALHELAKR